MEHRREILRPIWFVDAYSNTNCNCDTKSNTDYASSAYPSTASVRMLISDLVTNVGVMPEVNRAYSQFFTRGQSSRTLIFKSRQR